MKIADHFPYASDSAGGGKRRRVERLVEEWKSTHEELCSKMGIAWPPDVSYLENFTHRQAEVTHVANEMFPAKKPGWSFMDGNHSAERLFRLERTEE